MCPTEELVIVKLNSPQNMLTPKKKYTCQKGFLIVYRAKIHNQSLAASVYRGLLCTLPIRNHRPSCQAFLTVPAFWAHPYKGVLGITFWPMAWHLPHQLELHSYIFICIFTDQSEWLHKDQDQWFWPIRTVLSGSSTLAIWILHLHKNGPIRDQGGYLLL